mgnify:CR=1 FL=1
MAPGPRLEPSGPPRCERAGRENDRLLAENDALRKALARARDRAKVEAYRYASPTLRALCEATVGVRAAKAAPLRPAAGPLGPPRLRPLAFPATVPVPGGDPFRSAGCHWHRLAVQ